MRRCLPAAKTGLLAAVLLGSAAVALARGGVIWRGTRYPLDQLRRGCVRIADWPASGAAGWPADRPSARAEDRSGRIT